MNTSLDVSRGCELGTCNFIYVATLISYITIYVRPTNDH
jgi:hypothetical protein